MKRDFHSINTKNSMKIKSKLNQKISAFICANLWLIFLCFSINAQTLAPGAPGKDAQWATAGKQGVGTSASLESKVWFTLAEGVMTEVYYPDVTVANVHLLQFVVVNKTTGKIETEKDDTIQTIEVLSINTDTNLPPAPPVPKSASDEAFYTSKYWFSPYKETQSQPSSLMYLQTNWAKDKKWRIRKKYVTDPNSNTVLIDIQFSTDYEFSTKGNEFEVYVYYDPSINNSGMHDTAWTQNGILLASDENKVSALASRSGFTNQTNGFFGINDGLTQLLAKKDLQIYDKAENGNVVQFAKLDFKFGTTSSGRAYFNDTLALSFGKNAVEAVNTAKSSLEKGFQKTQDEYHDGWSDYVKTIPKVEPKYQAQFNMAAMILKAHEDKTKRGANIASLTIPWGGDKNANENTVGGYHLIWSRDLYQVATAFMALGDKSAAIRALDFLFDVQQKADGSFPQNSYLDGKPFWGSLQMDEVAFPLILAYQLERNDKATWENHVKPAANFIVKSGPTTPQERWEERSGYSPSTIAAEIAGLVCAAEIARKNGDTESASLYLKTADEWQSNIEKWTATTNGKYGDGNYYLRITQRGNPNAGDKIDLGNGAGVFDEREIVDAGFLELVRLGIKSPDDPLIAKSVKVIDEVIRVQTPNGDAFYRYNHDGYGEMDDGRRWNFDGKYTGKGRLWALLSGERGQYELALSNRISKTHEENYKKRDKSISDFQRELSLEPMMASTMKILAEIRLDAMQKFANDGLMIPEQIWDSPNVPKNADKQFIPELEFGEGTGSATPLAWSMAQFIRLAVNLKTGRNLDTPDVVYNRYVLGNNHKEIDSAITQPVENGEMLGEPQVKFGEYKESKARSNDGLSLEYVLKPKNQEFNNFSINWDCEEKWGSINPLFEKTANRITKGNNIEFFQCNSDKTTAIIFYEGVEQNVEIVGDFTEWKPKQLKFRDFASESKKLKFLPLEFSSTARVEYKLIVDGKWILDPLNPNKVDNGVGGENSFFTMPDYQPTKWLEYQKTDGEKFFLPSKTEEIEVQSKIFGMRRIKVYLPGGYDSSYKLKYPVLYVMDGTDYIERAKATLIQETLVDAGKIKPFIMVFVDYKDRTKEYWANDDYAKFLATEVVPAIDKQYNTIKNRDGRAILGASLGGITSVHTALKYPEIFSRVGGQSSSFWVDDKRVIKELETLDPKSDQFRFYFDTGTLEGVENSRRVNDLLCGKGFSVVYEEGQAGHNWTAWRDRLADAFVALWK